MWAAKNCSMLFSSGQNRLLVFGCVVADDGTSHETSNCVLPFQVVCVFDCTLADLTVSKRPETSNQTEIHFSVVNHLCLLFSFVKLVET